MNQPTVINNRYRVVAQLGAGTLSIVYRCRDTQQPEQEVAVKVLFPDIANDARAISRIKRDYTHLRMLACRNVINAFDFFENGSEVGYSMEMADGDLARELDRDLPMPIIECVKILKDVCSGIKALHDLNLIHRNIKPENVLLMGGLVKVADLCCSKKTGSENSDDGSAASLDYVPPEYIVSSEIDRRGDIYALGTLGYELLTGRSPFRGSTVFETMTKRLKSDPSPPSTVRSECSQSLDAIILRALHREPDNRFQSADEMLLELSRIF